MPELPEVETIARGLHKHLAGDRIEELWIGDKSNLLKSPAQEIARVLCGSRIEGFRRVGKHIVANLASKNGPAQWVIHLGMTGRCLVCEPVTEHAKHTHLIATLASGRELRFVDPRRFGKLQVLEGREFTAPGAVRLRLKARFSTSLYSPASVIFMPTRASSALDCGHAGELLR
jgi:formamidopyrimidine-DNA glycosylase